MKYCIKCGTSIEKGAKFCIGCGYKINEDKVETKKTEVNSDIAINDINKYGYISLALYFGLPLVGTIISYVISFLGVFFPPLYILYILPLISYLGKPAGIVTMIIMRVKDPKSTFGKVLMWIYICLTIVKIILIILVIVFFVYVYMYAMSYYN